MSEQLCPDPFAVEHILPRVRGGLDVLENLALSCAGCNGHKYTKIDALDPTNRERVPLFHPRRHQWNEHFEWSSDFTLIIGLTPAGRATIEALRMNRVGVVNLRRALYTAGLHPPQE
ncbi:MAG: HNH endonuclease [Janthinobacterium lividum]